MKRFMWITPGRVFYSGLLGAPSTRRLGGWIVYFSADVPFSLCIGSHAPAKELWPLGTVAIVPPYQPHIVVSAVRHLSNIILEPESVDSSRLAGPLGTLLRGGGGVFDGRHPQATALRVMLGDARDRLGRVPGPLAADDGALDRFVFGAPLPKPDLDARIAKVVELLDDGGEAELSAHMLAAAAQLSFSRFVHLFKQEVGVPLRTFRSWKRARSLLHLVTQDDTSLTEIAQRTGYPDSTHFSHSIRQVFGLQPKELMAGSRRITLVSEQEPSR
jgi:AraC-like DNA-binding protein